MRILRRTIQGMAIVAFAMGTQAWAASVDITVNDQSANWNFGSGDGRGLAEDNETEPGTIRSQAWDLEAFVAKDGKLYVVGGFNYEEGVSGYSSFSTGDIFLDNNNNALWGNTAPSLGTANGYQVLNNAVYKYNFVIDLEQNAAPDSMDYAVYALDESVSSTDRMQSVYYRMNDEANPWTYLGREDTATGVISKGAALQSGSVDVDLLTDAEVLALLGVSVSGGSHYVIAFDMSWYTADDSILTHYTMGCGNDNLIGQMQGGFDIPVPDGGVTLLLLGMSVTGLGFVRRRMAQRA